MVLLNYFKGEYFMRAILVDDDRLTLEYLAQQILKIGGITIIGKYTNPTEAKEKIIQQDVDVVFLDIQLPKVNGLRLAEKILDQNPEVNIVFVTGFDKYAAKAFEINAIDYLVKPISMNRLKDTVQRIKKYGNTISATNEKTPPLYINVLGPFSIEKVKGKTEFISWRTKKAFELFLYLLRYRDKMVRKSFLIELLWSDIELERANDLLYTTIYYVRKTLRPYYKNMHIQNALDGYVLRTRNVMVDFEEWKNNVHSLPELTEQSIDKYLDVMSKYKGAYLQGFDFWWAEAERHNWEQVWLSKALEIAEFYYFHNYFMEAKKWYRKICEFLPETEEAHFALMKIYDVEDSPSLVKQQYQALKSFLEEEIGVSPCSKILEWYRSWENKLVLHK
jgi:two-component system, LytTR family, response regulator